MWLLGHDKLCNDTKDMEYDISPPILSEQQLAEILLIIEYI